MEGEETNVSNATVLFEDHQLQWGLWALSHNLEAKKQGQTWFLVGGTA